MRSLPAWILFILSFLYPNVTHSQYWMQRGGGATIDEATAIAADINNNTYTTGYFTFTTSFENNTVNSTGLEDIFIVKTTATGNIAWLISAGGPTGDRALSIDVDDTGNSIVTGYFTGTATFGSQTITSAGQRDVFIAKYNGGGNLLWVTSAGGVNSDIGNSISFDNSGNIIITGEFSGSCSFGSTMLTSLNNSIDVFTAKYDGSGNFIWAKQGSGNFTDRGTGVSTDASDNIYVTGIFSDTITFDQPHYNTIVSSVFVIKYDALGQEQWFRWMGSPTVLDIGGIAVNGNDVNLTGSFGNAVYFYGNAGNPSLIGSYTNNIFVCRYDLSGNLMWQHADGSSSPLTANSITVAPNGEVLIAGNFKCRFSDFSAQYGSGTFCSLGYWDNYVASYDNNGNWIWARNSGGHRDDFMSGITITPGGNITTTGSFKEHYFSTYDPTGYIFHGINTIDYSTTPNVSLPYCSDSAYVNIFYLYGYGNSDVFINSNINLNRQPYDFFKRQGGGCSRPYSDLCINQYPGGAGPCPDTLTVCGGVGLIADLHNYYDPLLQVQITPLYHFLWNDGDTIQFNGFNSNGYATVMVSTDDGCFVNSDSVYIINNPFPSQPTVSDSKGINVNSTSPLDIPFCIFPDSVTLTCTNVGINTVSWSGFAIGQNPVTVQSPGIYSCSLINSFGCSLYTEIKVVTGSPLAPIVPEMICLNDSDFNDTLEICLGSTFFMYLFDTISNPTVIDSIGCLPGMLSSSWNTSFNANVQYNGIASCPGGTKQGFLCNVVDSFSIDITAIVYRENPCYRDSFIVHKQLYIIVHDTPTGTVNFTITGPAYMCPGGPDTLIASPSGYTYNWAGGPAGDSLIITQAGLYTAIGTTTLTNGYGCNNTIFAVHSINVQNYPQPTLNMAPINGVICPGDSVYLYPSGTGTVLSWEGPTGTFGINEQSVFVSVPGTYTYVTEVAPGCIMVSSSVDLTLYSSPTLLTSPGTSLCLADSIILQIISDPLGSIIQWEAPFFDNLFSHTVDSPGTYLCSIEQCYIVTPFTIEITEDTAEAIIYSSSTTNILCSNDSVLLSANSGMATYEWQPAGIFNDSIYVSQSGNYTLITTSAGGCTDSAQVAITAVPNTLTPPLINDTTICKGYSVLLNAWSADSVYWSGNASYSNIFNTGNQYQAPSLQNPVTYYLFTQAGVCRSVIDSVNVSISSDTGIAVINSSVVNNTICSGDSILLTANTGMAIYEWLPLGVLSDSIYVLQTGDYSLISTSSFGCSDTASIAVTVIPNTLAPPSISDSTICPGNALLLNAVSNDSIFWSATTSYSGWFNTGNFYQTNVLQNPVTYYLFTQSGICRSDFDSVTIGISQDTAIAVIYYTGDTIFCNDDSLLLYANTGMSLYEWLPAGILSDSIYVTQTGNYSLITSSTFGCRDTATIVVTATSNTLSPPLLADTAICSGEEVVLNAISTDPVFWTSTTSYTAVINNGNTYTTPLLNLPVTYYLFTSDGLCKSAFDSATVSIINDCDTIIENNPEVFLPNVFTPNNDGINDFFPGQTGNFTVDLKIYNRWGTLVFNENNLIQGWNGYLSDRTKASDGTYYAIAVFIFKDGSIKRFEESFMLLGE